MSFNTLEKPEGQSHGPLQPFRHRHVHIPSAPGPSSSVTMVVLSPIPSDLPIAPLGPISLAASAFEKDPVGSSGMTDEHLQSQSSRGAVINTTPADSPSTVTDSSRQPGAEHSDSDNEASPPHKQVSTKAKKKKRTRTLTTAPQAAALFALLARTQFPTTGEREEIGRAIGLSARKVQIWFQNQRQKQKKLANTLQSQSQAELATSAPLPLMSQPGYSASHAARCSAGSALGDNQSLGVAGFGTSIGDYGAVTLHSPYAEGISRSSGSVPVVNTYQYSLSSGFSSRAHTDQSQRPKGHPQLSDYTHVPSQYNVYPTTTIPDFTLPFSSEPPGAIAASSFATQSWFPKDIQQGRDATSLPHPPTASTPPHVRRFIPPSGPTASAPATRSLYNSHVPLPSCLTSTHYGSAAQLMHPHDIPQTTGTTTSPSQVASLHIGSPTHRVHHGSFSYTTGPSQDAFPSTPSGHIPSSSLPESLNPAAHGSPHSNLIPPYPSHSRGSTTLYGSQTSGRSFGAEVHSEIPTFNRKRPRSHEERVVSKRPRQGNASSLSPPASFSETAIPSNRNRDAMQVPLPTHPPLFQGHITDPYSEAVPQPWRI